MSKKYYSDLGKALTAMEFDYSDGVTARIRRRGPRSANIEEIGMDRDGVRTLIDAEVEYFPDQTTISSEIISPDNALQAIEKSLSSKVRANVSAMKSPLDIRSFEDQAVSVDQEGNPLNFRTSFTALDSAIENGHNEGELDMSEEAGDAIKNVTDLVATVSPETSKTLQEKFATLTPGQKVAAGVGVYVGGKAALSFIPMKYLLMGAAFYFYTQMNKNQAANGVSAQGAATTTPVAGMC